MPIVVNRRTGDIISKPEPTQQQKDKVWACIVNDWAKRNNDEFVAMIEEKVNTQERDS